MKKERNIMRTSRARPGGRPVRWETRLPGRRRVGSEYHRPGRAWARELKISRARPGAGWARRGRPGPARPHLRKLAPYAKTLEFEILDYLQFENITKRDMTRDTSDLFVRKEIVLIVIFYHGQMS